MIVGVAVCPGAPFLIEGTAPAIASTVPDLLAACGDALDRLPAADRTVLIGSGSIGSGSIRSGPLGLGPIRSGPLGSGRTRSGSSTRHDGPGLHANPGWWTFPPGTAVRTTMIRGDVAAPRALRLPDGGSSHEGPHDNGTDAAARTTSPMPSVATLVGAHLLITACHMTPTSALEIVGADSPSLPVGLAREFGPAAPDRVSLLVIADGAACHGDNAPGRRDDRSGGFDAAVASALAAGDPAALRDACRNPDLPADAVMASVGPLALLADLTLAAPPDIAELLYSGAPFGVGYFVASWQWTRA